jgi:hypothetical protein
MLGRLLRRFITRGELALRCAGGDWVCIGVAWAHEARLTLAIRDHRTLRRSRADPTLAVGEATFKVPLSNFKVRKFALVLRQIKFATAASGEIASRRHGNTSLRGAPRQTREQGPCHSSASVGLAW